MNYGEFKRELRRLIKDELGKEVQISFEVVEKNNGKREESIVIHKQNGSQTLIGLSNLYESYSESGGTQYCLEQVLIALKRGEGVGVDEAFYNWERVKELISMRLVNLKWNKNRLKELAYKRFFDLAVTFHVTIYQSEEGSMSVIVSRKMIEHWEIGIDDLWESAMNNLKEEEFQMYTLKEMIFLLKGWSQDGEEELLEDPLETFYVLTNRNRVYGAVGMFRADMLSVLAEKFGEDLYIIPSSVHEVILVPVSYWNGAEGLKEMVKQVNETEVVREERLSNELYYYSREKGVVLMV